MIRVHRVEGRESLHHGDREFTLVSRTWTVAITAPGLALGWRYQQPHRVESRQGSVPIYDYLMVARVAAVLILLAGALARRKTHD